MLPLSLTSLLLCSLSAFTAAQNEPLPSLKDVLSNNPNLTKLNDLLSKKYPDVLSILQSLSSSQELTIIAPNDEAFGRIPDSQIGKIFAGNDSVPIRSVLEYHVLPGNIQKESLTTNFQFFPTLMTDQQSTNVTGGQRVGGVAQGAAHDIVFVSGYGTRSNAVADPIPWAGGTLWTVGMPLIPPGSLANTAIPFNLTSFLGALYKNDTLGALLNTTSDLTLFVPTNAAMNEIASTMESLDPHSLNQLLTYHVVLENLPHYTPNMTNNTILTSMQGSPLTIRKASNAFFVNGARMLQSDILIGGGAIHIVDSVLSSNASGAVPDPAVNTQAPMITGSPLSDGSVPYTSLIPSITATPSAVTTAINATLPGMKSRASGTTSASHGESTKKSEANVFNTQAGGLGVVAALGAAFLL